MSKKKLATVWLAGCSGCHMSLLDIDEKILEVAALADIVKSPIVDGKDFPEADIVLIEGAVANEEHLTELRRIRERAKILVALGDCAVNGNVPALRNFLPKEEVLNRAYAEAESNASGLIPSDPEIARLIDRVRPLHEVVKVDVCIPGCPPPAELIYAALVELLNGRVPVFEKGRLKNG
jgi:NAD-reducing hydrogenase small subunit